MPAPEKPPNLVIYMPQLHLSDSLLAEAILAARQADINAEQIIEAREAEDRKLRNRCEEMSLLAAVEARNIPDGSWEDGAAASSAVWQSPECIVFY